MDLFFKKSKSFFDKILEEITSFLEIGISWSRDLVVGSNNGSDSFEAITGSKL
jgi:hypothetical protein